MRLIDSDILSKKGRQLKSWTLDLRAGEKKWKVNPGIHMDRTLLYCKEVDPKKMKQKKTHKSRSVYFFLLLKLTRHSSDDLINAAENHREHTDILHLHKSHWPLKKHQWFDFSWIFLSSSPKQEESCNIFLFFFLFSVQVQHLPSPRLPG